MVKFFLFLCFCLSVLNLKSQSLSPEVKAAGGSYFDNGSFSLSYTLGEPVIETYTNGNIFLTQGFQQPNYVITSNIESAFADKLNIKVYPNPSDRLVYVDVKASKTEKAEMSLTDNTGKIILTQDFYFNETAELMLHDFAQGQYVLRIVNNKGVLVSTHQIQKIH